MSLVSRNTKAVAFSLAMAVVCTGTAAFAATPSSVDVPANAGRESRTGASLGPITESAAPFSRETLASIAAESELLSSRLRSYVCHEQIERHRGLFGRHFETINARLSFNDGAESYSEIERNSRPFEDLTTLGGAWSTGEFGTLLKQTQHLLQKQAPDFQGYNTFAGEDVAIYRFGVGSEESSWDLNVDGRHYMIGFDTEVWLSKKTGQILKIKRRSANVPSHLSISQIDWTVTFSRFELDGQLWLLPSSGEYSVGYSGIRGREWNRMKFTSYQHPASDLGQITASVTLP